jgi:integrase
MARTANRLTALKVERANRPGMYADGGGLYLRVTKEGTKNWVYRFMLNGRPRWMGVGPLALYGLQEARGKALDARRLRHEGIDPIDNRRAARLRRRLEAAKSMTFKQCAERYIASHGLAWRNAKHAAQWSMTLLGRTPEGEETKENYCAMLQPLSVQSIDTALIMKVLEPIWTTKPETAGRVRGRIEAILDWAKAREYRTGENPARWRGHLDKLLPGRSKVSRVEHHAALPYAELPDFMRALRAQEGVAARALEFAILTAARTGETIGAKWSEVNLAEKIWAIPADRMKAGKEHRVPLSAHALAILGEMHALRPDGNWPDASNKFVFPGGKGSKPLSNMAFLMLLRRMKRVDLTAHGFRSSFRDWASERTNFPNEVAEMALAHTVGDKVEAAYRRGDLFEKRRRLMTAWAEFCSGPKQRASDNVALLRRTS